MKQHTHKIIALVLMLLIGKMTLSAQEQLKLAVQISFKINDNK